MTSSNHCIHPNFFSYISLACKNIAQETEFYKVVFDFPDPKIQTAEFVYWKTGFLAFSLVSSSILAHELKLDTDRSHLSDLASAQNRNLEMNPAVCKGLSAVFSHNVNSEERLHKVLSKVEGAGGQLILPAQRAAWGGLKAFFRSPAGHIWEVCHNPLFEAAKGDVTPA